MGACTFLSHGRIPCVRAYVTQIIWRTREHLTLGYLQPRKRRQQVTAGKKCMPCNVTRLRMEEV